jgi:hypothetical protein
MENESFPSWFRRGGSAHNIALWLFLLAETGWLNRVTDGNFNHLPQIHELTDYPG